MQKKYYLPLGLLIQIVFVQFISFFPELIEGFYSNGFYTYISNFSRIIVGFLPFSVGDLCYLLAIIFLIFGYFKNRRTIKLSWKLNTDNKFNIINKNTMSDLPEKVYLESNVMPALMKALEAAAI